MDSVPVFLYCLSYFAIAVILFAGAVIALRGRSDWRTRTLATGSCFLFLAAILGAVAAFALVARRYDTLVLLYLPLLILLGLGILIFFMGAFPFCAKWGAQGGRIAELEELTNALLAAQRQRDRETAKKQEQPEGGAR